MWLCIIPLSLSLYLWKQLNYLWYICMYGTYYIQQTFESLIFSLALFHAIPHGCCCAARARGRAMLFFATPHYNSSIRFTQLWNVNDLPVRCERHYNLQNSNREARGTTGSEAFPTFNRIVKGIYLNYFFVCRHLSIVNVVEKGAK